MNQGQLICQGGWSLCAKSVSFVTLDCVILLLVLAAIILELRQQLVAEPFRAKLLALYFLGGAMTFNVVYQVDHSQNWAYFCQMLCGNFYDTQILYYFASKSLTERWQSRARSRFITGLACLINLFFVAVFIFSLVDSYYFGRRDLCDQVWFQIVDVCRFVIILCTTIGVFFIRRNAVRKMELLISENAAFSFKELNANLRHSISMVVLNMIAVCALEIESLIYAFTPNKGCVLVASNQVANNAVKVIFSLIDYYIPASYAVYVFLSPFIFRRKRQARLQQVKVKAKGGLQLRYTNQQVPAPRYQLRAEF